MNQLIHFYRMDTLASSHDSIILLLENVNSLQAKYRLMMAYFAIDVYPNPAKKNYIFVEYTMINNSGEGNLFIYSSDGKLQFTKSLNRNKHDGIINTRDWEQGIYFYKFILLGEKDQNGKIVILK